VHDRERRAVEALGGGEVVGQAGGDRDLSVREAGCGAVGPRDEPVPAELVEAVLGRDAQRDTRGGAGGEPEQVGVDEMSVEDVRPASQQSRRHGRIEVEPHAPRLRRHSGSAHPLDELGRPWLALVQHDDARVEPARPQPGKEREKVGLGPGDTGDLLHVKHPRHRAAATIASAQCSTE